MCNVNIWHTRKEWTNCLIKLKSVRKRERQKKVVYERPGTYYIDSRKSIYYIRKKREKFIYNKLEIMLRLSKVERARPIPASFSFYHQGLLLCVGYIHVYCIRMSICVLYEESR